uniref:Uncharacterized protein n=1 Tax=Anguilla anguilla TaxID=7936 RepID=A0A0E9UL18_ANGAN
MARVISHLIFNFPDIKAMVGFRLPAGKIHNFHTFIHIFQVQGKRRDVKESTRTSSMIYQYACTIHSFSYLMVNKNYN